MTQFEIDFLVQRKKMDIKKQDVAKRLNITAPTLQARLKNPSKLTLQEFNILEEMGFNFNNLILKNERKNTITETSES